jgi:hypothetical protein
VIASASHLHPFVIAFVSAHDWIAHSLQEVFTTARVGYFLRHLIALITLPLLITAIPSGVYYLSRKRSFPYAPHVMWAIWLVQTSALIVLYHGVY